MQQQLPTTEPDAVCDRVEDGNEITVVDVRAPHEFERGHIEHPNATVVNVPLYRLQANDPQELLGDISTENIVTVCASGNRSTVATRLLNRAGFPAENLQYGMNGWRQLAC
jgi:rhodanese-related sulfurtransferase